MLTDEATRWINDHVPGWEHLPDREKAEIVSFSILWSLFEARVFDCEIASSDAFWEKVDEWNGAGMLDPNPFQQEIDYFRDRYITNGDTNRHFGHLNIRRTDKEELASRVLAGELDDIENQVATALFIVYRYRNNFFHGEKWTYEFEGQLENFSTANQILMEAIEIDSRAQNAV